MKAVRSLCVLLSLACAGRATSPDAGRRDAGSVTIDAATDADVRHPFGSHGVYTIDGVGFPSNHTRGELDAQTRAFYEAWKAAYLEPACEAGQYRVRTSSATAAYTVSEGHGYGMLIVALVAGAEPAARELFDGLYAYYAAHPSDVNPDLMAWAQDASCGDVMGADSATDGDLDIAYALLLADRQWGSDGPIDYLAAATRIIAAIRSSDVHPSGSVLVGDWASDATDEHYTGTRMSDHMPGHFKAFAAAFPEARWTEVVDRSYALIAALQDDFAPATGLLPDFAVDATGANPRPAPPGWLEGDHDGDYAWNACRTPWRIATDYLVSGDARARAAIRRLNAWFRTTATDDPANIRDGYSLAGEPFGEGPGLPFVAPLAVAAMVEPPSGTNAPWRDALWDELVRRPMSDYYGDSLKLLAMLVVSGNWWMP